VTAEKVVAVSIVLSSFTRGPAIVKGGCPTRRADAKHEHDAIPDIASRLVAS
jgi:hypothetical protein